MKPFSHHWQRVAAWAVKLTFLVGSCPLLNEPVKNISFTAPYYQDPSSLSHNAENVCALLLKHSGFSFVIIFYRVISRLESYWGARTFIYKTQTLKLCHFRSFLRPSCQSGFPWRSMLATTGPCWSTRQLSDRTVFQWTLKDMVTVRASRVQEHNVSDKHGRPTASGGWCAMKSLRNSVWWMQSLFKDDTYTLGSEHGSVLPISL